MFCSSCGAEISDTDRLCSACGEAIAQSHALSDMPDEKPARGCFFWGCLSLIVLSLVICIGVPVAGFFWMRSTVLRYTADKPAVIKVVEIPQEEVKQLNERISSFLKGAVNDLVLSEKDINALIEQDEELRGQVYIRIKDGKIGGEVSIPADIVPGGSGRFFNASALFNVSMKDGFLWVTLSDASVNGESIPAIFLKAISGENLMEEFYKDKNTADILQKVESVRIEEDNIILKIRADTNMPASTDVTRREQEIDLRKRKISVINAPKC
ncbi:MAG: zinc ribbon domain-containing protein [Pirellulales bacterium]